MYFHVLNLHKGALGYRYSSKVEVEVEGLNLVPVGRFTI
eukprot:SAG31_NODE_3503_length_4189_cov_1.900978_3_plen_39_part_00